MARARLAAEAWSDHRNRSCLSELRDSVLRREGMTRCPPSPSKFSAIALPIERLSLWHRPPSGPPFGLLFRETSQGARSARESARRASLLLQVVLIHRGRCATTLHMTTIGALWSSSLRFNDFTRQPHVDGAAASIKAWFGKTEDKLGLLRDIHKFFAIVRRRDSPGAVWHSYRGD